MSIINWREELFPYKQATDELYIKFNSIKKEYIDLEQHSPIELVQTRVKSIASIIDKSNKRDIHLTKVFEKLEDIAGVRIICKFVEDIYKVVQLIRDRDGKDLTIKEEEDYINNTKSSGYRSYHITIKYKVITATGAKEIPCEIQIRTMAMNFWATIEHSLRYKYNGNMPTHLREKIEACAEASFKLDTEMGTIREEIIETQKVIQIKENLVYEILKNIQNLYYIGKIEEMNEFNKEFIDLYQEGDIEKLNKFNNKLHTMATLYKVSYIG
ncbi:GTP pyrophosphokinase family protein [uncultured Tyzzerella sp.]|uniref:GTP pyrophosphokinase n=1 Tax=uncultured Tyzzerella sp. TaxID=2321398 RepID=UPI002942C8DD|nr:GTP pyrophosphokinase family protein [uncultured Tyzzerella sp.]